MDIIYYYKKKKKKKKKKKNYAKLYWQFIITKNMYILYYYNKNEYPLLILNV